jgi:flavin reductase ActVB
MAVTDAEFKAAMASFASGVVVVTTIDAAGTPFGFTATAFASVSRNPPLCLVCPGHSAEALPTLRAVHRFAVNILGRSQEPLSTRFATHGIDKFDGVPWKPGTETGCPLLAGALVNLECTVEHALTAGDHDVLVGRILSVQAGPGDPLLYFRGNYRELLPP